MIVRSIDSNGDWNFGRGKSDYVHDLYAAAQCINTRLNCFLGDCFFDLSAGIDWWNLLGAKNKVGLNLAISSIIIGTDSVTGIVQLVVNVDKFRNFSAQYEASCVFDGTIRNGIGLLLDENGDVLLTESGDSLHA